eukprot:131563_1
MEQYFENINNNLFKHINIDDCDQPIITTIHLISNAVHSLSIFWGINDQIFDKLNLKKPSFLTKSKKSKKSDIKKVQRLKLNNVMNQLQARVDKVESTVYTKDRVDKVDTTYGIIYKDTKEAKKRCKIIFQVCWKEIIETTNVINDNEKLLLNKYEKNDEGSSFVTNNEKKQKKK